MVLHEGCVYAIGGGDQEGITGSCEYFEVKKNKWHDMSPLRMARAGASATSMKDTIYVFGGQPF